MEGKVLKGKMSKVLKDREYIPRGGAGEGGGLTPKPLSQID